MTIVSGNTLGMLILFIKDIRSIQFLGKLGYTMTIVEYVGNADTFY